ncbi:hypothetical protein [Streptomyces sp. NPDC101234]|uniref:hypothetical protein n=1 Tax=Streptomyces sp. NPDC101234 TaxID=3366138 RepID=UPI0037FF8F8C
MPCLGGDTEMADVGLVRSGGDVGDGLAVQAAALDPVEHLDARLVVGLGREGETVRRFGRHRRAAVSSR